MGSTIARDLTEGWFDDLNLAPAEIANLVLTCQPERVYVVDDERFVANLTVTVSEAL
ncbi:MAG: hypothetical protein ACRC67_12080 [Inquilinus sp.]|uniref:hypothetical protein n=1 Tax=Inquilinus sp. TaxID=1932117 RepID=UPI003F3D5270